MGDLRGTIQRTAQRSTGQDQQCSSGWWLCTRTLLTTSEDSSSGGMWVMVPHVRVSTRERQCISRDSPKSATLAVMPCGAR